MVAAAVSDLSWDIVDAMSTVKELVLSPGGIVVDPLAAAGDELAAPDELGAAAAELDELDEVDELQAAAARATTAATIATDPDRR